MEVKKIKILVLEDDYTIGEALREAFLRAGHEVFLVPDPDGATDIMTKEKIDFMFVDCLLPKVMGIDYVEKIRKDVPTKSRFKIILMSGIYTDKDFVAEAMKKTQAIAFLKKPFDLEEALKLIKIDEGLVKEEISPRKSLYQIFARNTVSNREKRKMIEALEEVSGFDLPFVYSLLVETKSSGHLNIYTPDGNVSGVSFSDGIIVGVDIEDKTTYLGEMLIQSGYTMAEDVQEALTDKSPRRLGQRLIQANKLSPHGFDMILTEQMNIRLSRTIVDRTIRINFAAVEVELSSPGIDSDSLSYFLHDWIASKLSVAWLKSMHLMWASYRIIKSSAFKPDHPALQMSLVQSLENFTQLLEKGVTMTELMEKHGYNEAAVHKALHFLLTKGLIVFQKSEAIMSPEEQLKTLKKIWLDIQTRNHFQVVEYLGIGQDTVVTVNSMIDELMTVVGPQPKDPKSEVFRVWNLVRTRAQEACNAFLDGTQRQQYKQNAQKTDAEKKLRGTSLMEEAKQALQMNQYAKAIKLMNEVASLNTGLAQFHLYYAWAKIGIMDPSKKHQQLKDIDFELMQVPPDEKYDAVFVFVTGLSQKAKGDIVGARKSFEKCLALNTSMIVARRELNQLAGGAHKDDLLSMDLKKMVSGFFKKK